MTLLALDLQTIISTLAPMALPIILFAVMGIILVAAIALGIVKRVLRAKAAAAVGAAVVGKMATKKKGKKQQQEAAAEETTETPEQ